MMMSLLIALWALSGLLVWLGVILYFKSWREITYGDAVTFIAAGCILGPISIFLVVLCIGFGALDKIDRPIFGRRK